MVLSCQFLQPRGQDRVRRLQSFLAARCNRLVLDQDTRKRRTPREYIKACVWEGFCVRVRVRPSVGRPLGLSVCLSVCLPLYLNVPAAVPVSKSPMLRAESLYLWSSSVAPSLNFAVCRRRMLPCRDWRGLTGARADMFLTANLTALTGTQPP